MRFLHKLKMLWYQCQMDVLGTWKFFCRQEHKLEKDLIVNHYNELCGTNVDNEIVFTCNGWIWSGGLADRLKGILGVYQWCKENDKIFKINFVDPFVLQNYLKPHKYDWIPKQISYNINYALPKVCLLEPRTSRRKDVLPCRNELIKKWLDDNLNDSCHQLHIYTNLLITDIDFANLFNELFVPCERLQQEILTNINAIGDNFISISFRFTTLLGDFADCTGSPLPDDRKKILIRQSLSVISRISDIAPQHSKILVTADSMTFLREVVKLKDVYVISGKVGHMDYASGDEITMKTFLDFLMIGKAAAVYLAKGPGMYNSAFAKTSALLHNKPFMVYEY